MLFNNRMPFRPLLQVRLPKLINKSMPFHNQDKVPRLKLIVRSPTWSLKTCLMSRLKKLTLKKAAKLILNTRKNTTRSTTKRTIRDTIWFNMSQMILS